MPIPTITAPARFSVDEDSGAFLLTGFSVADVNGALTFNMTPVNALPTISVPAAITVVEDSSAVAIAGLSVADVDGDVLTVTLSAEGDLALSLLTGLTFTVGDGSAASAMTFSGSVADINAALATLTYAPASNDDDGDSINISVWDGTQIETPGIFAATFDLSSLLAANGGNGSTGFVLNGIDAYDRSGFSVSSAGDVNGDGIDDLIIGAMDANPNGNYSGESYVVFGSSAGFGASFELSTLDGTNGFVINGIDVGDRSGWFVSSAGDVNGDGIDDLIIGAQGSDPNGSYSGESYVVFGSSAGFGASFELSTLASGDGSTGFVLNGIDAFDRSGFSVSSAGDVNGDGIDDLIIGAKTASPNGSFSGESYVVFGSSSGFSASFNLSSLLAANGGDGSTGFVLNGIDAGDESGFSVSSAGDVNGDGIDDLIIGAPYADPNGVDLAGESYVVFGSSSGFGASIDLSTLDGTNGFVLNGIDASDVSGSSVSSAGDVNGDGIDDLIIGAFRADPNVSNSGESYLVFGSSAGFGASFDLSTLASGDGSTGFVLNGIDAGDSSGFSVSSAGDINGDGIDDLIIGAYRAAANGNTSSGETYVVFGSSAGFGASFDLSTLDGTNGFVINGIDASDQSGSSVSSAGDVNGDGIDDLIIGASRAGPNGGYSGESYVVFGRTDFSDALVSGVLTVNMTPVNALPTISIPASITIVEDSGAVAITNLSITDIVSDVLTVTLSAEADLALGLVTGLTFTVGDGSATSAMTFSGSVADINAALATLTYTPSSDDIDGDSIVISVTDGTQMVVPGIFAATIDLSSLLAANGGDGSTGFVLNGIDAGDESGFSVSSAGDVNGDGIDDLIIGAHDADPNGNGDAGESYVVFGSSSGFSASFNLSSLLAANGGDGSTGFVLNGIDAGDESGFSVSSAGDVNGDGIDDLIIGARRAGPNGSSSGESYVVFGSSAGFGASFELSTLASGDGSTGFVLNGIDASDRSGWSVSSAGDVNGDGIDDLIIGAVDGDPNGNVNAGESYVVFGSSAGFGASFELSTLASGDGSTGFVLNGVDAFDASGFSVSSAGDVNGDGIDDLIIGAKFAAPNGNNSSGESYVVFGSSAGFGASFELSTLASGDGSTGFVLNGINAYDRSGVSVSSAGDVNGDGIDDLIIGAYRSAPNGSSSGESYVVFGSSAGFGATFDLSTLDGTNGFVLNGVDAYDRSGFSVSSAGDINGDGIDDLIIGAYRSAPNGSSSGESYVVFGSSAGFGATFDLSTLDGTNGFVLNGIDASDESGNSVSSAGDVNGDGIDDLIIGASSADPNGSSSGESYVVFGRTDFSDALVNGVLTVYMTPVNDLPTISVPAAITVAEDSGTVAITGLSVADIDGDVLTVTLSAQGDLALTLLTGLSFAVGDGSAASTMTFSGSVADINAALATLTYTSAADDDDGDSIAISVRDGTQGVSGPGTFAATFELSSLLAANGGDGSTGFVLNGINSGDRSGFSVSSAGDVNGDGIDDLIIGARTASPNGNRYSGESYVVFGSSAGFGASFELSTLASGDGSVGFVLNGVDAFDYSGFSVSSTGDVNGDGVDDLIIGARGADPNGSISGESYVVFGSSAGFGASFDLSTLASGDGSTGFVLNGIDAFDRSGSSVSSAGDVNGDGIDDLIIGAYRASANASYSGESYVVFGSSAGFGASFDLSTLDGTNGFVLNGIDANDNSGFSVSSAGDVNGDGIDDLIIGARSADSNGNGSSGESYVVFGSSAGFGASFDLSTLASGDGSTGFVLNGIEAADLSGYSVSSAGDVNGDGIADLIIGAFGGDPSGNSSAGESYVVFGSSAGFGASFELSTLDGTNGFVLNGIDANDRSGFSVSSAGDVNGDGIDDLIIGARYAAPNGIRSGESYVVFGSSAGFGASIDLSTLDGTNGFVLNGIDQFDWSGNVVSSAGDVNGDGIDDLIIGVSNGNPNGSESGESYVVYGRADFFDVLINGVLTVNITPENDLPTISVPAAITVAEDSGAVAITGLSVADVDGDVLTVTLSAEGDLALSLLTGLTFITGDGSSANTMAFSGSVADINEALATLTYAPASNDDDGDSIAITVWDGTQFVSGPGTFAATFDLSSLLAVNGGDGSTGFVLNGIDASDESGFSVSSAGDVNGDGIDDLIIAARDANPNGSNSGESYVVFGSSAGFGASFELSTLASGDGSTGFVLNGVDVYDASGYSVSSAGDVNGDGIDDLIIGAFLADPNGTGGGGVGESYVVFGSSAGFGASFELSALASGDGSTGFVLNGIDASDYSGRSVSSAGDVNGDGIDDLIIGAYSGDPSSINSGESYVVFGSSAGFGTSFELSTLASGDGSTGFVINGIDASDRSGWSVSSAGDVNGDGIDDLIIGAAFADPNGFRSGESYVVFGSNAGFGASIDLSTLNGTNGFVLNGIDANDESGRSVSSAGDVNGDGIADLIIGAAGADPNGIGSGESYVVFGSSTGFGASFELSTLASGDGSTGFVLNGIDASDYSGYSVSSAGDVNGDGIDDLIIGAAFADPNGSFSGESYVVFGSSAGFGASIDLSTLDGTNGFVLNGIDAGDESGVSVSSAGDVNGDGIDDLIIGATFADPNGNVNAGESYVVYGRVDFSDLLVNGTLTVNTTPENDAPTLGGDQAVAVLEGGSVVLTVADFVGTDIDDDDATLSYTVSNLVAGTVHVAGVSVSTFTSAQLAAGDVSFVHDGSETLLSSFDVSAADDDGLSSVAITIAATVTPENDAPTLSGDLAGSLNDGGLYVLTAADLSASDVDDATSVLLFTVSNVVNGTVLLNGAATAAFTQADIDAGRVSFRHDPAATADGSFEVTVADDDGAASAASTFTLTALGPVVQDGTSGVDDLDGGDANDYIRGLDDNDRIDGFDGNDQLFGNAGDDTLVGGNGDDILNGGNGDDRLFGGAGADDMDGRGGFDLASYKTATSGIVLDLINGANNTGDAAGDTFANIAAYEGTRFNDTMTGDANTNRMFGLDGEDTLNGGGANDRLLGGDGNDTLNGDDGADLLYGDDGDDILNGGNGRDVLVGGDGADTFNGGADIDRVTYKPSDAGVTIDLTNAANSTGDALGDTFNSIELIEGSQFDDVFIGSSAQDRLFGLDGADQMMAGAGNDLLEGGNGNDVLDGGADADILRGGEGNDTLTGGAGKDRFQFGANEGADTITDFNQAELDRMQFTDASGVESMTDLTIVQQGNDTLITYAEGMILLEDFTANDLAVVDFSFL